MKSKLTKTNQINEMDLEALEQLKSISISCVREKIFELQQGICPFMRKSYSTSCFRPPT